MPENNSKTIQPETAPEAQGTDLAKLMSDVITKKMNDGTVEKLIDDQLTKVIGNAISQLFGYNSEAQKLLNEKLNTMLIPAISAVDFDRYTASVDAIMTNILNQSLIHDNKVILENFSEYFAKPVPKEVSMQDLIEAYIKYVKQDINTDKLEVYDDEGPENASYQNISIDVSVEYDKRNFSDYEDATIYFTCPEDEDLLAKVRVYRSKTSERRDWRILYSPVDTMHVQSLRHMNPFDLFVCKLYNNFAKLHIEKDHYYEDDIELERTPEAIIEYN